MSAEEKRSRIFVALSGGVDSAVAAYLLREQGHEVIALYMENWRKSKTTPHCTTEQDRRDALRVALNLGIPFDVVNFEKEYEQHVVEYFYREYEAGRTPNPDVVCNTKIKFKAFLDTAISRGATMIATGHYARIRTNSQNQFTLCTAVDHKKDQSYFLYTLTQQQLSRVLFPVGGMTKIDVRNTARRARLPNAEKPDSQGICFLGPVNISSLLRTRIRERPGEMITSSGDVIGKHRGIAFYTIGQREGLGIGGGVPYFVAKKVRKTNTLIVAHGNSDPVLYAQSLTATDQHWIAGSPPKRRFRCHAVIRYHQKPQQATVSVEKNRISVHFATPQRAVTPGQSIVLYQDDVCLGGAVIEEGE
jgi:tRNA-specific 2-thiouridylase